MLLICCVCSLDLHWRNFQKGQNTSDRTRKRHQRHDQRSTPGNHADEQGHLFDILNTKILGHAKSRHAREILEAWHSIQSSTINRHIDIPETHLQLKRLYPGQCPKPSPATTTQAEKFDTSPPNTFTKTAVTNACGEKFPFTSDDGSMN